MIEENAWLENSGTLATIYGNVPVKDDDANVHIYQSYPSMYVNFIDADTVETDGRLLSLMITGTLTISASRQRTICAGSMGVTLTRTGNRHTATDYRCITVTA